MKSVANFSVVSCNGTLSHSKRCACLHSAGGYAAIAEVYLSQHAFQVTGSHRQVHHDTGAGCCVQLALLRTDSTSFETNASMCAAAVMTNTTEICPYFFWAKHLAERCSCCCCRCCCRKTQQKCLLKLLCSCTCQGIYCV